jgi:phosphoribosylformimino-5-aminoimidazole carboxamide ribonucleotide (ProFAR) isomerase
MLIPSIDLRNGKVVQLVQGERLALEDPDLDAWIRRFASFPKLQLIDLDAAIGTGSNDALVRYVCAARQCRVGGGIRTLGRALDVLSAGATHVIVGSSLFRDGQPDLEFAEMLARELGAERVIAAIDAKGGRVAVKGWRETVPLSAADAARALEPYCSEFLYTHVDKEGLMQGTDIDAILAAAEATGTALEINGALPRLDMSVDALRQAQVKNVQASRVGDRITRILAVQNVAADVAVA